MAFSRLSPIAQIQPPPPTSTPSARHPARTDVSTMINTEGTFEFQIDPALHQLGKGNVDIPIDPALFELEGLVNDVRRGKVKLDGEDHEMDAVGMEDDDIDPALREIVNSLTNAQQSSTSGPNLTHAQAAAAINAHMTDNDERERLQQSLEEITQASFGSFFPTPFPHSPPPFEVVPEIHTDLNATDDPNAELTTGRKSRGRPRGSKNKPKANPPPPRPKKPKPPPKKRGRPPKERTEEEQLAYEQRKEERALGIKRRKGRPRKFPGYLVRDMRLKKNRAECNEIHRRAEAGLPLDGIVIRGEDEAAIGMEGTEGIPQGDEQGGQVGVEDDDMYGWPSDDQVLLDAMGPGHLDVDDGPSGLGKGDHGIREVFGLNAVDG